jgi:hypothetical protein
MVHLLLLGAIALSSSSCHSAFEVVGVRFGASVGQLGGCLGRRSRWRGGVSVGRAVGVSVGSAVAIAVGVPVGFAVGSLVRELVGVSVGILVGVPVSVEVGVLVGVLVEESRSAC